MGAVTQRRGKTQSPRAFDWPISIAIGMNKILKSCGKTWYPISVEAEIAIASCHCGEVLHPLHAAKTTRTSDKIMIVLTEIPGAACKTLETIPRIFGMPATGTT